MKIDDRLRRLEDAAAGEHGRAVAQVVDSAAVLSMVGRLASRFPDSAASISLADRLAKRSPAGHCAWDMRFAPVATPFAKIMALHGHPVADDQLYSGERHAHC